MVSTGLTRTKSSQANSAKATKSLEQAIEDFKQKLSAEEQTRVFGSRGRAVAPDDNDVTRLVCELEKKASRLAGACGFLSSIA